MSQASPTRPLLLVVDDEEDTSHALCLMLQRSGYRVAAAYEPYGANSMVQELLPDGVILDLNMPAGGGRRFFDWMLANQTTAKIPVVVYSALADPETQKELLAMGARAFIDKSSPPDVLIAALVSIVGYVPPPEQQQQPAGPPGATYGPPGQFPGQGGYQQTQAYGQTAPPPVYGQSPHHVPPEQISPEQRPPQYPQHDQPQPPPPGPPQAPPQNQPIPPVGGVPYPFTNAEAAPPPPAVPRPGEPTTQQQKLQDQLRVQAEMQGQRLQFRPQASAPPQHAPPQHAPPQHAPPQQAPPQHAPPQQEQEKPKATILLVDDSPDERFSLAVRLRRKGYTVLQASNGHSALELARVNQPDVILSDVHMPGISGLQLCQSLKKQPDTEAIPVFIMSGLPQSISKKELNRVGGAGFFEKPIDLNLLLALLQNIDNKKQSAAIQGFTNDALGRLDEMF